MSKLPLPLDREMNVKKSSLGLALSLVLAASPVIVYQGAAFGVTSTSVTQSVASNIQYNSGLVRGLQGTTQVRKQIVVELSSGSYDSITVDGQNVAAQGIEYPGITPGEDCEENCQPTPEPLDLGVQVTDDLLHIHNPILGSYVIHKTDGSSVEFSITDVDFQDVTPYSGVVAKGIVETHTQGTFSVPVRIDGDEQFATLGGTSQLPVYVTTEGGARTEIGSVDKFASLTRGTSLDYEYSTPSEDTSLTFQVLVPGLFGEAASYLTVARLDLKRDWGSEENIVLSDTSVSGGVLVDGTYFSSSTVVLQGTVTNEYDTITSVELWKGDQSLGTAGVNRDGGFVFPITPGADDSEPQPYTVVVTTPHTSRTFTLSDFQPDLTEGIAFTRSGPVVSIGGQDSTHVVDGVNWHSSVPELRVRIAPESPAFWKALRTNSIEVSVGSEVFTASALHTDPDQKGIYTFDVPADLLVDGEVTDVKVTASDWVGRRNTSEVKVGIDTVGFTADNTSVKVTSPVVGTSWGYVSQSPVEVRVSSTSVSGIASATYNGSQGIGLGSGEYSFTVSEDTPEFLLTDNLGREYSSHLDRPVFVDSEAPRATLTSTIPNGGWSASSSTAVKINLEDNLALGAATVSVNGVEQSTRVFSKDVPETSWESSVDLSKVPVAADGVYTVTVSTTDIAGNRSSVASYTVNIDTQSPTVTQFEVVGAISEGTSTHGSDRYGFFLQGATTVNVYAEDVAPSSGLQSVYYELLDSTGRPTSSGISPLSGGVAVVQLPANFKGFIRATAQDNVGNVSESNRPDGIVSETSNVAITATSATLTLPTTPYQDAQGTPLFNKPFSATYSVTSLQSGIRSVSWEGGSASVNASGTVTGAMRVDATEKNLVTQGSGAVSLSTEGNGNTTSLSASSRAGYEFAAQVTYSIDTIAPEVSVSYSSTSSTNFYNSPRSATITVRDANFTPSGVNIQGSAGSLGAWTQTSEGVWTATMLFSDNAEYNWSLTVTDRAANVSSTYSSGVFTVDTVNPEIAINWVTGAEPSATNPQGTFFRTDRVAIVTVTDTNFDPASVTVTGDGQLGSWLSNGTRHTATLLWSQEGDHLGGIQVLDKAGNQSPVIEISPFTIDKTSPELSLLGITPATYYHEQIAATATVTDKFLDSSSVQASLVGRKGSKVDLLVSTTSDRGVIKLEGLPEDRDHDDLYTLHISAKDWAGNEVDNSTQFVVNRYGSVFDFMDQDINGGYLQDPVDVKVQETTAEEVNPDEVQYIVTRNGQTIDILEGSTSIQDLGTESTDHIYEYTLQAQNFQPEGVYRVLVNTEGVGGARNTSAKLSYNFVIDRTRPDVAVSGVTPKGTYTDGTVPVTVTARDSSGVTETTATLKGIELVPTSSAEGVFTYELPVTETPADFVVASSDRAGNQEVVTIEGVTVKESGSSSFPWGIATVVGAIITIAGVVIGVSRKKSQG